jgi:hypothetical protein
VPPRAPETKPAKNVLPTVAATPRRNKLGAHACPASDQQLLVAGDTAGQAAQTNANDAVAGQSALAEAVAKNVVAAAGSNLTPQQQADLVTMAAAGNVAGVNGILAGLPPGTPGMEALKSP